MAKTARDELQVQTMLQKVYANVSDVSELDGTPAEGIYEALLWVLGDRTNADLLQYIEE